MLKRRILAHNDEVIIIYDKSIGFIEQTVRIVEYRKIKFNDIQHETPVFKRSSGEITGIDCFWILPSDIKHDSTIFHIQKDLIELQVKASEIGKLKGFTIPEKIEDPEIRKMVDENIDFRIKLKEELGYDPLDYSWVEKELAETPLEKKWFRFQRENDNTFTDNWETTIQSFNKGYHENITIPQAVALCRKWKRFLIGAWNTIVSKNENIEDWKQAARKFEEHHHAIEDRMDEWQEKHKGSLPAARVKEPVTFLHGPYFNECIERVPKLFTSPHCAAIRPGVVLQVTAYDPETKFIKLDFMDDVKEQIKPKEKDDPWHMWRANYVIRVAPDQVESHLEIAGELN